MENPRVYCVTGIDTGIGKTIATGLIAGSFLKNGVSTITQKIVQTGCTGLSEDIIRHRQLMEIDLQQVDYSGLTCPYVFPVACSPHLAAKLDGRVIDCEVISKATASLLEQYDLVFLEGAGGLSVPLSDEFTLLDYLEEAKYPLVLVSSSRLGSINHTLNALELATHRKIDVAAIVYNRFEGTDSRIVKDSREVFANYLKKNGFTGKVIDLYPLGEYAQGMKKNDFYKSFMLNQD